MSHGPPGSSWGRPSTAASRNADSTRARHFRALRHSRTFAYGLVPGCAATLVAGAWLDSFVLAAVGPFVVAALAALVAYALADRRSERDFFVGYAADRGLTYVGDTAPLPLTPLLGAGDRRRCEHWLEGELADGLEGGLGHYAFEVSERDSRGLTERRETHRFTVCVVDLEAGIRLFPGVFLCRRRGVLETLGRERWLSRRNRHRVELESERLCERYELWVDDAQDELLLRELFAPSLQVLLAEHPLAPCFEYRAGTLVVYVECTLEAEGRLDWLRELTASVAARFGAEVEEARPAA